MGNRYEEYRLVLVHDMVEEDGEHYPLEPPISVASHLDVLHPTMPKAYVENETFEKLMWEMRRYWEKNKGERGL